MCLYYKDDPVHFKLAIESMINQTLTPNEIVLVIDGKIGKELENAVNDIKSQFSNLKIIRFSDNKGHGEARRESIRNCKNKYIAIMDSDDISNLKRCELQVKYLNSSNIDVVGGLIEEFKNEDVKNVIGTRDVPLEHDKIVKFAKKRCPMNQVTIMFKKDKYDAAGGYLDWYCEEDYYLWLRMIFSGSIFANLSEVLVHVRTDENYFKRRSGIKYFRSEISLQKYMLSNKFISFFRFLINWWVRFLLQVVFPGSLRNFVYKLIRK